MKQLYKIFTILILLFAQPINAMQSNFNEFNNPFFSNNFQKNNSYESEINIAYISTYDDKLDNEIRLAVNNLSIFIKNRTSIEPNEAVELNYKSKDIYKYPFIYWLITEDTKIPDQEFIVELQNYLRFGGIIVFDLADGKNIRSFDKKRVNLFKLLNNVIVTDYDVILPNNVLHRSYYLLDNLTGIFKNENLYNSSNNNIQNDFVPSIIISSNGFYKAWQGSMWDQEMSFRSGLNIMMVSLTGNYKTDQIHIEEILKRLGENE